MTMDRSTIWIRVWRVGFGTTETKHISRGPLYWRRLWWRIWVADVWIRNRSQTRVYLTRRIAQLCAAIAVRRRGVHAACEAMRELNRSAKVMWEEDRDYVYRIKQRFLEEMIEQIPCTITKHEQILPCHSCNRGIWTSWDGRRSDRCWRCGGSGVYARHMLYLFSATIAGRTFSWHQPARQWPNLVVEGDSTPYEEEKRSGGIPQLGAFRFELLIETVTQWIDAQGLRLGIRCRPMHSHLWTSVRGDVQTLRRRWSRIERRPRRPRQMTVMLRRPTVPLFPARGAEQALLDAELPF